MEGRMHSVWTLWGRRFRLPTSLFVFAFPVLFAQTQPALIRGVLLERDTPATGEFSVRNGENQVFRYHFDAKTYVERENQMIDVPRLQPGEKVEVVSDSVPGSILRYARTVHVYEDA